MKPAPVAPKKGRTVPTDLATALAERSEFRELGKKYRQRAIDAEEALEVERGKLVAAELRLQEQQDTISALNEAAGFALEELKTLRESVADLRERLRTASQATNSGTTIIVSREGGEVLEAIAHAKDDALKAIQSAATQVMMDIIGDVVQRPEPASDHDTISADTSETEDDLTDDEDDGEPRIEPLYDEPVSDADMFDFSDDDDEDVVFTPTNESDDTDDNGSESAEGEDDFQDASGTADEDVEDVTLSVPNLINIINDAADRLEKTWESALRPFVTDAIKNGNRRLVVREAINAAALALDFTDEEAATLQTFANGLEEDDFNRVLEAVLTANDGALNRTEQADAA